MICDLEQQMAQLKKKMLHLEGENKVLRGQQENEIKEQWESNFERFPPVLDQVKGLVIKIVFMHKQQQLENLVEALELMT